MSGVQVVENVVVYQCMVWCAGGRQPGRTSASVWCGVQVVDSLVELLPVYGVVCRW